MNRSRREPGGKGGIDRDAELRRLEGSLRAVYAPFWERIDALQRENGLPYPLCMTLVTACGQTGSRAVPEGEHLRFSPRKEGYLKVSLGVLASALSPLAKLIHAQSVYLWGRCPSDPAAYQAVEKVGARFGVSRRRVTDALHELERAGLVALDAGPAGSCWRPVGDGWRTRQYARLPLAVAERPGLGHGAKLLHAFLLLGGSPSLAEQARALGVSRPTAKRWRRELRAAGL